MSTLKTRILTKITAFALLSMASLPNLALASNTQGDHDAYINYAVQPSYPMQLGAMGISEGSATILIALDNSGKMLDWVAVSATRPEFVKAVTRVIDTWEFKPAVKDGHPIPTEVCISVKFKNDNVVMSMNGFQMVQALMNSYIEVKEVSLVAKYSELDRLPEPTNIITPVIDSALTGKDREGEVVLGFFIDAEGHVRMPVLMEYKGDVRLVYAAYDALTKWEFAMPVSHGKPIMVRASQKFIFKSASK